MENWIELIAACLCVCCKHQYVLKRCAFYVWHLGKLHWICHGPPIFAWKRNLDHISATEKTANERYFRSPLELFPKNYIPQKRMQYALNGVMMMMMAMSLIALVLVVEPLQQQQRQQQTVAACFFSSEKIVMCNTPEWQRV